ncbi:unnamed protein product [Durusdinium trenchii]|uniref:Uncharacterized protein n=1 Tax=Durusdinium trenchii TaxID=1381693 RepID=A0ABP0KE06_9DINO
MASQTEFSSFWPPLPSPQNGEDAEALGCGLSEGTSTVPKSMVSFPSTLHPQGMPVFGWLPPRHALKPQRRIIIGRKQHKRRIETLETEVVALFEELREDFPKSDSLKRLPLFFITGPRFKRKLDEYLRARLRKGVPSLFRTLRSYYYSPGEPETVEELLLQYAKCLREARVEADHGPWKADGHLLVGPLSWCKGRSETFVLEEGESVWLNWLNSSRFGPLSGEQSEPPKMSDEEPPTALLFTLMTLAEHFDFMGETHKALEYGNEAIEHTPTLVELYACKARIYKHAGDLETSAKCYEEVREMDLADRYLNTQCVRALLRIDETQQGMEKAQRGAPPMRGTTNAANLHEMQCMWYESAVGRSYYRQKKYGKALKQFHETFKHFSDIAEDQFDFHNYCLRKTTLKAYVSMLRMQERPEFRASDRSWAGKF